MGFFGGLVLDCKILDLVILQIGVAVTVLIRKNIEGPDTTTCMNEIRYLVFDVVVG